MTPAVLHGKSTSGTWASIFPVNQESLTDSALFMRRLLYVGFSQIIHSRGLLPKECFKKRRFENLRLYIFHMVNPDAYECADQLRAVCETIEMGYLREFHLIILDKKRKDDEIIEVYKMGFNYGDDKTRPSVAISSNEFERIEIDYKGKDILKEQTTDLLFRLHHITSKLSELPETAQWTFYIQYSDEKTPKGFQARGFNRRPEPYSMAPDAHKIVIGDSSSGHHACAFEVASVYIHDPVEFEELISGDLNTIQDSMRIDSRDISLEDNTPSKDINSNLNDTFEDVSTHREVAAYENDSKRRAKGGGAGLADLEKAAQKIRIDEKAGRIAASSLEERQPARKILSPLKKMRQQKENEKSASSYKVLKNSKVIRRTPGNVGIGKNTTRQ